MHKVIEPSKKNIDNSMELIQAINKTQAYLLGIQKPGGFWQGDLIADASVSAGYISLMFYMTGQVEPIRQSKVINKVLEEQNSDGSWSAFYAGPGDLSASIQTYLGLKIAKIHANEPFMKRAGQFIRSKGGIEQANLITKVWLALFGQYDWNSIPSIPPEIIFLPNWFPINIYEFASWSRATIMALTILLSNKPVCEKANQIDIQELYLEKTELHSSSNQISKNLFSWKNFFQVADQLLKGYEKLPIQPGRHKAIQRVEKWILEHQEADGSWGGIMLPWIYSMYALKSLGYSLEHPVIKQAIAGLEDFIIEDDQNLTLQPAVSPVWDTAWTVIALSDSGLPPNHSSLTKAAEWLLSKEIQHKGDWAIKNPHTHPGGWSFEFYNNWYPDLDDSAIVPQALNRIQLAEHQPGKKAQAIERALNWVLEMQSSDGGWAAFDRDNTQSILVHAPFADFISPLDPTCADVTAHVVEFLQREIVKGDEINRAVDYLRATQESDGAWYGRWGVNYLYGTALVLSCLANVGEDPQQDYIQKAIKWLISQQNSDGGWGETCYTYIDPAQRGIGDSTASQTAWVLIGLIASRETTNSAVIKGIEYLIHSQQSDGTWKEDFFTGSGFPKVFYLRYDLYRIYFPLIALARFRTSIEQF
jgi:squalene-hopene/tetraprenyl-beta-curcumene cyclase